MPALLVFPSAKEIYGFSLAELFAPPPLFLAARLLCVPAVVAENGGPPLVTGCCGSPWAADRPTFGRFLALLVVSGLGLAGRVAICAARQGGSSLGGCFLGWLAAVEDDLLHFTGGVSPCD